ncbi:MAG: RDD family protein [Pseudomonadota bacterium]
MADAASPLGAKRDRLIRHITTPEGVPLTVRLAERSSRLMALIIDLFIIIVTLLLFALALYLAAGDFLTYGWLDAFLLLGSFLLRSPYFIFFELKWRGQTPGKRLMHIRVIDRQGGPLTAEAVVTRNLTREVEVFLPISVLMLPHLYALAGWFGVMCLVWTALVFVLVLFQRDAMRIGDLIAGTWVIENERRVLKDDLSQKKAADAAPEARYTFTEAELDAYGIRELQVLEDILRRSEHQKDDRTLADVSRRIRRKIGWKDDPFFRDDARFLQDYYTALRRRLEQGLLFGERRETKHDPAIFDAKRRNGANGNGVKNDGANGSSTKNDAGWKP